MQEEDKILKKDIQTESKFEYLFEYNPLQDDYKIIFTQEAPKQ